MEKYNLSNDIFIRNIERSNATFELLKKTPYANKYKQDALYSIISTAISLGVDPLIALDGGLYFHQDKIEMKSRLMSSLIRQKKHIIQKDDADPTICILTGTRADTGETLTASFSMKDAELAGLDKNMNYKKFPKDMLFARALSRLARQLFADVIGNCYVEGELENVKDETGIEAVIEKIAPIPKTISDEQFTILTAALSQNPELATIVNNVLEQKNITDLKEIPVAWYERIVRRAAEEEAKKLNSVSEEVKND